MRSKCLVPPGMEGFSELTPSRWEALDNKVQSETKADKRKCGMMWLRFTSLEFAICLIFFPDGCTFLKNTQIKKTDTFQRFLVYCIGCCLSEGLSGG